MKNVAVNDLVPIQRVLLYYKQLFGKDSNLSEVLTFADHILRETGTIARKKLFIRVKIKDRMVGLPCGTFAVESVTNSKPFQWNTHNEVDQEERSILVNYIVPHPMYNGFSLDINTIEDTGIFICPNDQAPIQSPEGDYVDFEHNGDHLKFNIDKTYVDVVVRIIAVDKDGYPFMTDKAAMAFAYFINLVHTQRLFFSKMADRSMLEVAQEMYGKHVSKARVPEAVTKNEMDAMMNVLTSMNRKFYNLPYGR
jgi:hypothetical protein